MIWGLALGGASLAQFGDSQQPLPVPPPPPPAREAQTPPEEAEGTQETREEIGGEYVPIVQETDQPWGLDAELLDTLRNQVDVYVRYAARFTCDESARLARYDGGGSVSEEDLREYAYLLVPSSAGTTLRELRQRLDKRGNVKVGEIEDPEPFPAAYGWVFLFSRFHEPFISFRKLRTYFEGFDLVHEIQFRGGLPFTDGRDIRQWEGTVLVDAFRHVPVELRAEPSNQRRRIEEIYRRWAQSFNILGFRTKSPPLGFNARIQFGYQRDGLSFPTELRYDTFKAIGPKQVVPLRASTRSYRNYRFTRTEETERIGDVKAQEAAPKPE